MANPTERWRRSCNGREHVVEVTDLGLRRSITWQVDGTEIASRRTTEERIVLDGGEPGAVGVRLPAFTGPARRVTWCPPAGELGAAAAAPAGLGGVDLDPEPGSRAAAREAWIRAHPHRHAARRTGAAVFGVLLSLLAMWLLARIEVAWPDISLPWPDRHLPVLPEWLQEVLDKAKYVGPVVLAYLLARADIRRRRAQDERKRRAPDAQRNGDSAAGPASGEATPGDGHPR